MDALIVPPDIGRIPHKLMSSKNFVIHHSMICLHGLLPADVLECWHHFVLACRLLCQTKLKRDDIIIADAFILKFCQ